MVKIKRLLDLLAGIVALVSMGPVLGSLDRLLLPAVLFAIPAGFWCDRREHYLFPSWLATLAAVCGMVFYAAQITRIEVAIPVVHAMVVLMIVRLMTPKAGRDYLQIFMLALFLLAGSSLIHLEIGFALYLIVLIFGVTLGLVLLTVYVTDQRLSMTRSDLVKLIKIGLILPAVSLFLMIVFFVVLPRTRYPLWNFLNPSAKGGVGLAETVQPGTFSQISMNQTLAFRAEGPELDPQDRYWRALVLNQSEEGRWVRKNPPIEGSPHIVGADPVLFIIFPEPRTDRYLVTLDRPVLVTGIRNDSTVDQMFLSRNVLDHRVRFEVRASPGATLKVQGDVDRDFYLNLPVTVSPRMVRIAEDIRSSAENVEGRINSLAEFFRNQGLSYAQDDLPSGPEAIEAFLFEKKRGYCEFFASAYITLARLAGIPARLVGGYYGGDYNPLGEYYLVSENAAHVWVEVLSANNTWRRIDPSLWAINASATLGARDRGGLSTLRQLVDSLSYQWVQAVVVFDLDQQITFFREARDRLRDIRSLRVPQMGGPIIIVLLICAALAGSAAVFRRKSKEARLLEKLRGRIRKRYGKASLPPRAGLVEIAEALENEACLEFARIYYGAVFRDRGLTRQEVVQLKQLLKKI